MALPTTDRTSRNHAPGLFLQFAGVAFAALILVAGGLVARAQYEQARQEAMADLQRQAVAASTRFTQFFGSRVETLNAIAAAPVIERGDRAEMKAYLERIVEHDSTFSGGLSIIDAQGQMRVLSGFPLDQPPVDLSDRTSRNHAPGLFLQFAGVAFAALILVAGGLVARHQDERSERHTGEL